MQGSQINLKWKSFHSNILSSFESMWEEEGLVDVTLATDGKCLKAHKIMLSASSPFFKKIFQMNPCQHPVIVLQDVHYSELESILKFVYKGEVNIMQEDLPLLLRAAETLQIRGLCRQLTNESYDEEEENVESSKDIKVSNERLPSKSPPQSPKNLKKIKSHHNYKAPVSPPPVLSVPTTELSAPIYPVAIDEIKYEPKPVSPTKSDDRCDNQIEPLSLAQTTIVDSDGEDNDLSLNTNESAFDTDTASGNFPFPPFPCPFCDRAYTRWGFRRRHIKACHTRSKSLPCKWCLEVLPSQTEWESHVCLKHNLSRSSARNGLLILEEAEVVLQIPQPTRLDALVSMIKKRNISQSEDYDKLLDSEDSKKDSEETEDNEEKDKESSPKW